MSDIRITPVLRCMPCLDGLVEYDVKWLVKVGALSHHIDTNVVWAGGLVVLQFQEFLPDCFCSDMYVSQNELRSIPFRVVVGGVDWSFIRQYLGKEVVEYLCFVLVFRELLSFGLEHVDGARWSCVMAGIIPKMFWVFLWLLDNLVLIVCLGSQEGLICFHFRFCF